jgi:hypothetical protein
MTRARPLRTLAATALTAMALLALLAGCGSGSSSPETVPNVGPAQTIHLDAFHPSGAITPGKPVTMSFDIKLPGGTTLTKYKTGAGPHTGVHLIIVRNDLAYIVHQHPPIPPSGVLHQTVTFPAPGPYHVLVDVYPATPVGGQPNFQLFRNVTVTGAYHPKKLPPFAAHEVVDGIHFDMQPFAPIHAIQAVFLHVKITDHGKPVHFVPWFGALAHAIFFEKGTLNYFHTHVCAPDAPNCGSLAGVPASKISGSSAAPGKLTLGVLLPVSGTWRLFVQLKVHGRIVTAPFTLDVH